MAQFYKCYRKSFEKKKFCKADRPVLTSINTISTSSTEVESLEGDQVDWRTKKSNVLGVEVKTRQGGIEEEDWNIAVRSYLTE